MKIYPVVFAMIALLLTAPRPPDLDVIDLSSRLCGLDGTATSQEGKAFSNHGKNRYIPPKSSKKMESSISLAALLAPGDDLSRFTDKKKARLIGYVIEVKPGGDETCNCKADDPLSRDTHIEIALSGEDAPATQRVIVGSTPRIYAGCCTTPPRASTGRPPVLRSGPAQHQAQVGRGQRLAAVRLDAHQQRGEHEPRSQPVTGGRPAGRFTR